MSKTTSVLFLLFITVATPTFAQTGSPLNYDQINQKNADQINKEYRANKEKNKSKTAEFFRDLFTIDSTRIKEDQSYNALDRERIKLLSCVRNIIQKHKGGYDAPNVAFQILKSASNEQTWSVDLGNVISAKASCDQAFKALYNFKSKVIDQEKFIAAIKAIRAENPVDQKIKNIIQAFYQPSNVNCKVIGLEAKGYAVFGGGAGIHHLRCLKSDGQLVNYAGVDITLGVGIELAAGVKVRQNKGGEFATSKAIAGSMFYNESDFEGVTDLGLIFVKPVDGYGMSDGLKVGVGGEIGSINPGVGFRIWNGPYQWSHILKIMN